MRKKDGSDYEPESLRLLLASLDRYLKEAGSNISIAKDREFINSHKVLDGKARFLIQNILLLMLPKKGFSAQYNTITNTDLNLN